MTLTGTFDTGGQEHFYLETQAAWAQGGEDGSMLVILTLKTLRKCKPS